MLQRAHNEPWPVELLSYSLLFSGADDAPDAAVPEVDGGTEEEAEQHIIAPELAKEAIQQAALERAAAETTAVGPAPAAATPAPSPVGPADAAGQAFGNIAEQPEAQLIVPQPGAPSAGEAGATDAGVADVANAAAAAVAAAAESPPDAGRTAEQAAARAAAEGSDGAGAGAEGGGAAHAVAAVALEGGLYVLAGKSMLCWLRPANGFRITRARLNLCRHCGDLQVVWKAPRAVPAAHTFRQLTHRPQRMRKPLQRTTPRPHQAQRRQQPWKRRLEA